MLVSGAARLGANQGNGIKDAINCNSRTHAYPHPALPHKRVEKPVPGLAEVARSSSFLSLSPPSYTVVVLPAITSPDVTEHVRSIDPLIGVSPAPRISSSQQTWTEKDHDTYERRKSICVDRTAQTFCKLGEDNDRE